LVNAVFAVVVLLGGLPGADSYLAGHNAERTGKFKEAIGAYTASASADPLLAPYARISAARCLGATGSRTQAVQALRSVLAEVPEGPWVLPAKLDLAGLLALDSQFPAAAALYAESLDFAPKTAAPKTAAPKTWSPKTWIVDQYDWAAAEVYVRVPEFEQRAYAYFRDNVATTVLRQRRIDAARYLEKSPDMADRFVALDGLIKSAECTDAWKLALRLLPEAVGGGSPVNINVLAPLLTSNKRALTDAQREAFQKLVNEHGDSDARARWMRLVLACVARSHSSVGKPEVAALACDLLLKHFEKSDQAGDALYWLASRFARDEKDKSAVEQYLRLAKHCPDHARADFALLAAAGLQKKTGDLKGCVHSLEQLVGRYPQGRHAANAWYWLGKHHEAAGHKKDAAKAFQNAAQFGPGNYYAHCAAYRLAKARARDDDSPSNGQNLRVDGTGSYIAPLEIAAEERVNVPDPAMDPQFERLMFFGKNGLEEGEWEALYLGKRLGNGAEDAPVYRVMCEAGYAKAAMDFAEAYNWGVADGKRTPARMRIEYPRSYWQQVRAKCRGTGIDPYLVLAIARQESTFRPALTSHAGARGIMQVMPPTAQWLAKVDPSIDAACIANLENPDNSFRLGIGYLLRMVERSSGNLVHALASYNAGPGNCSKWLKRWPKADLETFVENIPFGETRNYVKTVLGAYAAYHSLYPAVE